ncbi:DNA binding HTH domain Psq-type, partial [Trinorchestia longiramus]
MCPRRLTTMPYKKSMLEAAVKAVIAGTFTTKQSASVYGVPAGTISTQLRRKGYSGRTKRENGSLIQVDQQVLEWLQLMSEIGCFSLKNQLGDILREVFERLGLRDKLTAKMASQTLTSKFLQRNPNLPASFIESKEIGTNLTATDIDQWVAKQREHILNSYNLVIGDFLVESNSQNVFCCFEVGSVFPSIKNRFSRLIYKPKIDGPLLLTLYCCLCADGSFLKPVAVVKTEDASQTTMENKKSEFHILYSKHGKMDCEAAMLWLQLIHEETKQRKGKNPFIIYLDQFIRPLSLATLDFCRQRELILYYLPGHYPHVKLPFGMDVFYNLNGEYDAILASDDAKHNASSTDLTLTLLVDAWKQMLATNATTTEFRDFGILPLDPTALKSIVETIVPITMSSSEGLSDNMEVGHSSKDAAAVPQTPNLENDTKVLKNTQRQVPSPHSSTSSTAKRASRSALRSYKESSDTDEQVQLTSAEDGSLVSLPGADAETGIVSQKPNIKIKIKRSNRTPNDFCIESGPNNQNFAQFDRSLEQPVPIDRPSASSNSSMSCSHCNRERQKAVKSGVVEGLLYALKRIESSLRADTLHLYKTRYLSPYLRDHRPTEPSFLIWCEIMKCLEIGPEAVHQDYLMSRNMHEHHPFLNSHSPIPTKHSALP